MPDFLKRVKNEIKNRTI